MAFFMIKDGEISKILVITAKSQQYYVLVFVRDEEADDKYHNKMLMAYHPHKRLAAFCSGTVASATCICG